MVGILLVDTQVIYMYNFKKVKMIDIQILEIGMLPFMTIPMIDQVKMSNLVLITDLLRARDYQVRV